MIDRFTRIQLAAFAVVTVLAVGYASVAYVGLPALLGFGRYEMAVAMPETGNLYPGAVVTLRGVPVGTVTSIDLAGGGVQATLSIDSDREIPADSAVEVRSVSAIGEQYLDFRPTGASGPMLAAGSVVPAGRVTLPTQVSTLLAHVDDFATSLPTDDLNTTVRELSSAFSGSADDLRSLLDSSGTLLTAANDNLDPTQKLIRDLQPVLATQQRTSDSVRSFSGDLRTFTDQLRSSDAALRGAIERTPDLTRPVDDLVNQVRPTLPDLLANLTAVGQVTSVYVPNIAQTISVLPATAAQVNSTIQRSPVAGSAILNFKVSTINDPQPCTDGFIADHRDPNDLSPAPPATGAFCDEPADSPIGVRGTRNSPCPNDPALRSRDARGCGLAFQTPEEAKAALDAAVATQMQVAAQLPTSVPRPAAAPVQSLDVGGVTVPTPYDLGTGLFIGPDGQSYLLGGSTPAGPGGADWKSLILGPMGVSRR